MFGIKVVSHLWCIGVCLSLAGCSGSNTAPVSGTVLLDGKPVAGAVVTFVPAAGGRPAQGETDAQGKYRLSTFAGKEGDGAAIGDHGVSVTKIAPNNDREQQRPYDPPNPKNKRTQIVWLVPRKYSNSTTSGIVAKVAPGNNEVQIDLKSAP